MRKKSICLVPQAASLGGPRTFQRNLIEWAERSGNTEVHFDADRKDIDAFLVFGGPKQHLNRLLDARRRGIPVVQRLNGFNWIHRVNKTSLKYSLHAEAANLAIAFHRRFICSRIIYQSPFCEANWNRLFGKVDKPSKIVFNGTDIQLFHPGSEAPDLSDRIDFLLVEGSFNHGWDFGLDVGVDLAFGLEARLGKRIVMHVAGKAPAETQDRVRDLVSSSGKNAEVIFEGSLPREKLIELEQRNAFLYSSDIHAACPNSVIEALSCGLPVIGFDTGALKDVTGNGGVIVPYGTDSWKLEKPVCPPLIDAAEQVIRENAAFRKAARARAEEEFPIEKTAEAYISFCLE